MTQSSKVWLVVFALGVLLTAPGCPKQQDVAETIPAPPPRPTTQPEPKPPTPPPTEVTEREFPTRNEPIEQPRLSIAELNDSGVLQTIYFDFDRSDLTGISQNVLRRNAEWMKNNREYSVVVQGHCDSRGTIEYNLALGQRRANTVRDYLNGQGVSMSRLRTVTYGEERPAVQGSGESAWSRNRRAEFRIEP